jgi:uncharacterized protein YndB with AHSA1/START domain
MLAFLSARDGIAASGRAPPPPLGPLSIIRLRQPLAASAERAFDAWLDPATVGRWLFATASQPMHHVELDARVGCRFVLAESRDAAASTIDGPRRGGWFDGAHFGEFDEIDRPRRIVFTYTGPHCTRSRVTVEFDETAGGCVLSLRHDGVPARNASYMRERWTGILYGLVLHL